ncbi:hypothetical protein C8R46DRAFT_368340 [Mycena filopes]|nr:hypothetical protein C8R46DRAFT_368340 [Mycena filopes]
MTGPLLVCASAYCPLHPRSACPVTVRPRLKIRREPSSARLPAAHSTHAPPACHPAAGHPSGSQTHAPRETRPEASRSLDRLRPTPLRAICSTNANLRVRRRRDSLRVRVECEREADTPARVCRCECRERDTSICGTATRRYYIRPRPLARLAGTDACVLPTFSPPPSLLESPAFINTRPSSSFSPSDSCASVRDRKQTHPARPLRIRLRRCVVGRCGRLRARGQEVVSDDHKHEHLRSRRIEWRRRRPCSYRRTAYADEGVARYHTRRHRVYGAHAYVGGGRGSVVRPCGSKAAYTPMPPPGQSACGPPPRGARRAEHGCARR